MANQFRPQQPGEAIMNRELTTPDHTQVFFRELVSRQSDRWYNNSPIKRGVLYKDLVGADIRVSQAYPQLYFCRETVPLGSTTVAGMTQSDLVIWEWSTDSTAESSFNAEISYLGDSTANGVWARQYLIRRDEYDADQFIPVTTPLTALIGVLMTDGGQGYTKAHAEYDCGGIAEIDFVISEGAIIAGIVTEEGEGFNPDSQITIVGDGSGATCEPIIQPPEAILTSQKKVELSDNDPLQHEFVKIIRVYEILPGPWIPFTRWDDDLGPVQGRRRAVLNTGQLGGQQTITTKTNYEGRDGSSVVSIEIEERWTDGTGSDDENPLFPAHIWSTYSDERGTVAHSSVLVPTLVLGNVADLVRNPPFITRTWYEPYAGNPLLSRKFVETWIEVVINDEELIHEFGGAIVTITETTNEPGFQSPVRGLMVVSSKTTTKSPKEQTLRTVQSPLDEWPILIGHKTDDTTGIVVNYTKQVIPAGTPYPGTNRTGHNGCEGNIIQGPFIEDTPYDFDKTIRVISEVDLNTLPDPQCWPISDYPVNFPPQLSTIQAVWTDFISRSTSAQQQNGVNETFVSCGSGSNGGVIITSRNGFRGYAKGTVLRQFFYGPPNAGLVPQATKIIPSSGSVVMASTSSKSSTGKSADGGISFADNYDTNVTVHHIHDHLVSPLLTIQGVTVNELIGNVPSSGQYSDFLVGQDLIHTSPQVGPITATPPFISIAALGTRAVMRVQIPLSNPTLLVSGNSLIMKVDVIEHPFGIWEMRVYTITIP